MTIQFTWEEIIGGVRIVFTTTGEASSLSFFYQHQGTINQISFTLPVEEAEVATRLKERLESLYYFSDGEELNSFISDTLERLRQVSTQPFEVPTDFLRNTRTTD